MQPIRSQQTTGSECRLVRKNLQPTEGEEGGRKLLKSLKRGGETGTDEITNEAEWKRVLEKKNNEEKRGVYYTR